MKKLLILGASTALLFLFLAGPPALAQNVALNDGFEMQNSVYWTKTGNMQSAYWGVEKFDTTGNAQNSWCAWQSPANGMNGGFTQTVFLIAGVTYELTADIAYYNC